MIKGLERSDKKAKEIYKRAVEKADFEDDLKEFRRKYKIPILNRKKPEILEKFLEEKYIRAFNNLYISKKNTKETLCAQYIKDRIIFLEKYGFPSISHGEAMDKVLMGEIPPYLPFDIAPTQNDVLNFSTKGQLLLSIDLMASKEETLEYVRRNWKSFKNLLLGFGHKKNRIKQRAKRDRDQLICGFYEYYKKHPDEWKNEYDYIEQKVIEKMKESGYLEEKLTIESVKMVYMRSKNK